MSEKGTEQGGTSPRRFKPYPVYKDSGIGWLGEIPAHWEVKRFKALLSRNDSGVWGEDFADEGVIVLRSTEQTVDGRWVIESPAKRRLTAREASEARLEVGDLVVTKSSGSELHIGKTSIVDRSVAALNCCFSNFMQRLRVAQPHQARYFWYLLNSPVAREQLVFLSSTTTGLGNLNGSILGAIQVPVSSEAEQRAIAAFLDRDTAKIDALVAKKERVIELLQEKRTALITQAVTKGLDPNVPMKDSGVEWLGEFPAHWSVSKLKFVASRIVDCPHETPVYSDDGDFRVIRTADVGEGTLDLSNARRVTDEEYRQRIRRMSLEADDVVYSREGERFGLAALVPSGLDACLGQRMMQFRLSSGSSPRHVMWQLNSKATYQQAVVDTSGATSPHVNVETIKNFWLGVPPRSEQESIAKYIDHHSAAIDSLVAKIHAGIDRLKEFRATLISAAVTGKTDVREGAA